MKHRGAKQTYSYADALARFALLPATGTNSVTFGSEV